MQCRPKAESEAALNRWDLNVFWRVYGCELCEVQFLIDVFLYMWRLIDVGEVAHEDDEEDIPVNVQGPDIGILVRLYAIHTK